MPDRYERVARNSGEIDKVEGRARWIAKRWRGQDAARHSILRAFAGLLGAFACFEDSVVNLEKLASQKDKVTDLTEFPTLNDLQLVVPKGGRIRLYGR